MTDVTAYGTDHAENSEVDRRIALPLPVALLFRAGVASKRRPLADPRICSEIVFMHPTAFGQSPAEMKSRLLAVTAAGSGCRAALDAERYLGHRD
jgi:hypothetical protein